MKRINRPPIEPGVFILVGLGLILLLASFRNNRLDTNDIIFFVVLIPSIILHEVSHGVVALKFGDDTAKRAGRLTLNPLRHIDIWGTLILPALLILTTGIAFGYAKPVPVNTSRMNRDQRMLTGLAGPIVNIVLALLAALVINFLFGAFGFGIFTGNQGETLFKVLLQLGVANVVLAAFNLIPIPPLDGSSIVERFLPDQYWPGYLKFRQYSMLLLMFLVLFFNSLLGRFFQPFIEFWLRLIHV